ncbi:MAG: MBL fold metallo-hydrolase [Gemmatimonadota bacterium]|jgi:ribonuclease BN (tRNA processing enzyme)
MTRVIGRSRAGKVTAFLVVAILGVFVPHQAGAQGAPSLRTRVVLLGTGTPNADPERQGPATAVVVDDRAYLVDAGTGIVRRAAQAARDLHIPALAPSRLERVFITHLHSDHTLGLPDLLLTPWVLDRAPPLQVYGPPGIARMMRLIGEAWSEDIAVRTDGLEPHDANPDGYQSRVHEVKPGLVYEDDLMKVYAVQVRHGSWKYAYAYRFEGPDRTVVISGDTAPTDAIVQACDGCDVLVHEVYSAERFKGRPPAWQRYHAAFHTSTVELADLARRAHPGLLVLYHQLFWGTDDQGLVDEIRAAGYTGPLRSGRDLDVF